ncbi:beta-1,6-N-acetylglucosaminyltransferase [Calothrix sp. PCC 7507]|uniref:beta-1,6-N-acetylglucosaminyltransferase n=1 Tax=Calothrix sp. PCC 7507 TaxID=99598 RepID=UPI00029F3CD1|nr:beta-1,6-N-acetylglucosaminyltransferase [Calothrix sp. PCC 7507]AFY34771.1 glycosyl transferase family 14 [Calothrix sp. PCC 7507]
MKIAYLIQSHTNPEQIYRLVEIIQKSTHDAKIIVSHDFSSCNLDTLALQKSGVQVLIGKGGRGDFVVIQAYLNAIKWLIEHQINYDWLIYLSGQDYPIKPISEIENFLAKTSYDGFLEYFDVFSTASHWSIHEGKSRYLFKYQKINTLSKLPAGLKTILTPIKIVNYLQPLIRINLAYGMLGIKVSSLFNEQFICYGGSFFTTLSRKCVEYLYQFCQNHPEVVAYYQKVCVADESFVQTILINSKLFNLSDDNKRYFDFSQTSDGRPKILTINDYDALVQSNAHFARKFDVHKDIKILDTLDEKILQFVLHS